MSKIQKLAELVGISSLYVDKIGVTHYTTDEIRRFFLNAMSYDTNGNLDDSIKELTQERPLPEVISFFENEDVCFKVNNLDRCHISIQNESNEYILEKELNDNKYIHLKDIEFGYYNISVRTKSSSYKSLLIYAPNCCYHPNFIKKREQIFGLSVMLYALHSKNSMGIGDFSDLAEIVRLTAKYGGDIVGINPLGVMSPYLLDERTYTEKDIDRCDVSPYRTISRLFVNYIYLDLRKEVDFINSKKVSTFMQEKSTTDLLQKLNNSKKVLYKEVLKLKLTILEMMYDEFQKNGSQERKKIFLQYIAQKGTELDNLCLFETILENQNSSFWRYWNNGFNDITSKNVQKFRDEHKNRIIFYAYCHWLTDLQIKSVQKLASSLNMKVGIYSDLPIGAASNGVEVWENPKVYVLDAGIGAPADPMRPKGQSWGFTPYHPLELKKQHYKPFIKLVRENMKYSGALRIDHAMGLLRLFWGFFSDNNPVVQGAYIYYDMKDLVAILSIESNRHKCLIIGEDLGTVPEGFREYMEEHGLLSYKVFFRQKEKNGDFIEPQKYQYLSLAQTSTHDQATALGFWQCFDIEAFNECNLYVSNDQYLSNIEGRKADCENMIKAFKLQNININNIEENLHFAVNEYGAKTSSSIFLVRLCDIFKQVALDNAPGTVSEYPNWRIKIDKSIEEIIDSSDFKKMMNMVQKYR